MAGIMLVTALIGLNFMAIAMGNPLDYKYLPPISHAFADEQQIQGLASTNKLTVNIENSISDRINLSGSPTTEIVNQAFKNNSPGTPIETVVNNNLGALSSHKFSTAPNLVDNLKLKGVLSLNDKEALKTTNLAGTTNYEGEIKEEIPIYDADTAASNLLNKKSVLKKIEKTTPKTTTTKYTTTKTIIKTTEKTTTRKPTTITNSPIQSYSPTTSKPLQIQSYFAPATNFKNQILHTTITNPAGQTPYSAAASVLPLANLDARYLPPPIQNVRDFSSIQTAKQPVTYSASTIHYSGAANAPDHPSFSLDIPHLGSSATNSVASFLENLDSSNIQTIPAIAVQVYSDFETGESKNIITTPTEGTKYAENGGYIYR